VDGITCLIATIVLLNVLNPKKSKTLDGIIVENPVSAYKDFSFLIFLGGMMLFALIFIQYFSTMPLYYTEVHKLTKIEIGLLLGMNGFLIFVFEMPLIKWLENSRFTVSGLILFGAILTGLSFVVLNLTSWVGIVVIGMILMTVGEMIAFPFSNTFAMQRAKKGNQGEYMALYSIAFSTAHIFGHNIGMRMIDNIGFDNTWYIISLIATLCIFLFILLKHSLKTSKTQ